MNMILNLRNFRQKCDLSSINTGLRQFVKRLRFSEKVERSLILNIRYQNSIEKVLKTRI